MNMRGYRLGEMNDITWGLNQFLRCTIFTLAKTGSHKSKQVVLLCYFQPTHQLENSKRTQTCKT